MGLPRLPLLEHRHLPADIRRQGPADGGFNEPSGAGGRIERHLRRRLRQPAHPEVHHPHRSVRAGDRPPRLARHRPAGHELAPRHHPEHHSNTIWVADTKNNRLTQFNPQGNPTGNKMGRLGSGTDQLHWPFAIDAAGADVIVADTFNNRVERWNSGTLTTSWTTAAGVVKGPKDLTVVGNTVYVADTLDNRVVELDATTGASIRRPSARFTTHRASQSMVLERLGVGHQPEQAGGVLAGRLRTPDIRIARLHAWPVQHADQARDQRHDAAMYATPSTTASRNTPSASHTRLPRGARPSRPTAGAAAVRRM